ncbi:Acid stress protein IbaG [Candidatus Hartigia pinicola]|nr:Acid stress protein IbaG [Candidatus Hartigia pinicola]
MDTNEIKQILMNKLSLDEVIVNSNGNHFHIIAIGAMFENMNTVKQQQAIYGPLTKYIEDNRIHALSIKVYTPEEWSRDCTINSFS